MAQGEGSKCPHCGVCKFHDNRSYLECLGCGYIGWSWQQKISKVGSGKGNTCSHCTRQNLHDIVTLPLSEQIKQYIVRLWYICGYGAIEPVVV